MLNDRLVIVASSKELQIRTSHWLNPSPNAVQCLVYYNIVGFCDLSTAFFKFAESLSGLYDPLK